MVSADRGIGKTDLLKHVVVMVIKKESSEHPQERAMLRSLSEHNPPWAVPTRVTTAQTAAAA